MAKNNNEKQSFMSSIKNMFKRMFTFSIGGKKTVETSVSLEEEEIKTPTRVIVSNFIRNKFAIIGIIMFLIMFCFSFIGGLLTPIDLLYREPVLKNVRPGTGYLDYPSQLNGKNVAKISSGVTFSVGLTTDGDLHIWGVDSEDNVLEMPENATSNIADVAAGDRHTVALTKSGDIIGWGQNDFGQAEFGYTQKMALENGEKIVKLTAGEKYSALLTDKGRVLVWGAVGANALDVIPSDVQGKVVDFDGSSYNLAVRLDDGSVRILGVVGDMTSLMPEQIKTGEEKVADIRVAYNNAIALTEAGKVYVWGGTSDKITTLPKFDAKIVSVEAARTALYAVDENGKVYAWGNNDLGLTSVAKKAKNDTLKLYSDYFQTYAVTKSHTIEAWGNDGYALGTDAQGRDFLTRLIHGGRITLLVGVIAVIIQVVIGLIIGMISGFKGGKVDNILMRFTEIIASIPFMPLVITLSAFIGSSMSTDQKMYLIMVILGFLSWPSMARLVRSQILIEREKDFVLAARALGIKEASIIVRHILPNVMNICIVNMTLAYANMMLMEAALSFLGFGVQDPTPSWGNMLNGAQSSTVIATYWWQWILPAVCVLIAALSINLIGDALREALDPKENQ